LVASSLINLYVARKVTEDELREATLGGSTRSGKTAVATTGCHDSCRETRKTFIINTPKIAVVVSPFMKYKIVTLSKYKKILLEHRGHIQLLEKPNA